MRTSRIALLAAAALAGCSGSSSPKDASPQPPASGTSSIVVVAAGVTHKLYVPAPLNPSSPSAKVAVLDAATPHLGAGFIRFIDLGVTGETRGVGADGTAVVSFVDTSTDLYFIDATTDTVKGTAALPAGVTKLLSSDDPSYSLGVAVDATHRRVYASSSAGLVQYDLDSRAHLATYPIPPPENFAFDPAAGRIYSPFYLCDPSFPEGPDACTAFVEPAGPPLTDSFMVVDVASGKAYQYEDPGAPNTRYPMGLQPDAIEVDLGLGLAAVAIENPPTLQVFTLANLTFDEAAQPFTCHGAPLSITLPFDQMTAMAVDQVTHLLAVGREERQEISFIDLAKAKQGITAAVTETMPDLPGGVIWQFHADPHGLTVGIVNGRPYLFALNKPNTWVARIDLTGAAALLGGTGTLAPLVSYIQVPTPQ